LSYVTICHINNGSEPDIYSQGAPARPKVSPIYVYHISDYEKIHKLLDNKIIDVFSNFNTKSSFELNLCSIYRTITMYFDESKIEYHTFKFPVSKRLSINY